MVLKILQNRSNIFFNFFYTLEFLHVIETCKNFLHSQFYPLPAKLLKKFTISTTYKYLDILLFNDYLILINKYKKLWENYSFYYLSY